MTKAKSIKAVDRSNVTHILLDFFGTIVNYSPSRTEQGYENSYNLLNSMGPNISYEQYLSELNEVFSHFDEQSAVDYSEFSMDDFTQAFLKRELGRSPSNQEATIFVETYMSEWNAAVVYPEWAVDVIRELSSKYHLAIVTNTHYESLVPNHLKAMGIDCHIDRLVTSVGHGYRKPHPTIYEYLLNNIGIPPENAIFVGDTYQDDYIGPKKLGIDAYLIDPNKKHKIPESDRIRSLADLPGVLKASNGNTKNLLLFR